MSKKVSESAQVKPVKAVTLSDVAAEAGVSKVAVSVVLNNVQSRAKVSPATRQRILEIAAKLQYNPNTLARSLRLQRSNVIGFYGVQAKYLSTKFPFYSDLLAGLQQGCQENGHNFLMHCNIVDRSDDDIFNELLNGQIDGLVLYARHKSPLIERLVESRIPVVMVVDAVEGIPCIGLDDALCGRLLAQHLAEKGYQNVLYRNPEIELPSTKRLRLEGFRDEAEKNGMTVSYSTHAEQWPSDEEKRLLLSKSERPQVVVAYSDYSADGIVAFCDAQGIRIPEDLAVTGFDHLPSALRPARRLTTVHCAWAEVARQAVSILIARSSGVEEPTYIQPPVYLVEGDTT